MNHHIFVQSKPSSPFLGTILGALSNQVNVLETIQVHVLVEDLTRVSPSLLSLPSGTQTTISFEQGPKAPSDFAHTVCTILARDMTLTDDAHVFFLTEYTLPGPFWLRSMLNASVRHNCPRSSVVQGVLHTVTLAEPSNWSEHLTEETIEGINVSDTFATLAKHVQNSVCFPPPDQFYNLSIPYMILKDCAQPQMDNADLRNYMEFTSHYICGMDGTRVIDIVTPASQKLYSHSA